MATTSKARCDAIYAAVQAQPHFDQLRYPEETDAVQASIKAIFGADLTYLVDNVDVLAGTFIDPAGATVSTPTGPGTVTSPTKITGTGKII
jgi:hypothetical protein